MKLYYSPGACSLSSHIILREANLPFELVKVDLGTKKTEAGDDYFAVNPKGSVPALVLDSGEVLTECAVIAQYLADKAPASSLAAKSGTMERVRQQEWLNWVAAEFHKPMGSLFNKAMADKSGDIIKARIDNQLGYLDRSLAKSPFLSGSAFGIADVYAFVILTWGHFVGVDVTKYANIKSFMERIGGRAKVQEALKAEGLA